MPRLDDYKQNNKSENLKIGIMISVIIMLLLVILGIAYFIVTDGKDTEAAESHVQTEEISANVGADIKESGKSSENTEKENVSETAVQLPGDEEAAEDPQSAENQISAELGAEAVVSKILIAEGAAETETETIGIDVSKYQGNIDWKQVSEAGIDFAMIRVGYRSMESGQIVEDSSARYNLQEATANGIKVGAYFFSTAVTEEEAIEEAEWTAEFISQYKITYPVAYNCEGYENSKSRQYNLSKEDRTSIGKAFLNKIYEKGYTPMFYASKGELEGDTDWIASELEKSFKIWVSWYPAVAYPATSAANYSGSHDMWQYTNNGTVAGINYPVDVNVAYFGYDSENAAKNNTAPEHVEANAEAGHNFTEVNETVTAKDSTNLRNIPSQGSDSTVMLTLQNGQTATRTGISTSGWSRVIYNGETYYAVSSLLTTDLTVKIPEPVQTQQPATPKPDDGIQTVFTLCDDNISAKIEVNLRNIPSVTDEKSYVVATLKFGEVIKRTGVNEDYGWSRVEYNGQTLYCVSSYIYVVTEDTAEAED